MTVSCPERSCDADNLLPQIWTLLKRVAQRQDECEATQHPMTQTPRRHQQDALSQDTTRSEAIPLRLKETEWTACGR